MNDAPIPAICTIKGLTRDGTKIVSRIYLDKLHEVLAARASDHLHLRPAFEWAA